MELINLLKKNWRFVIFGVILIIAGFLLANRFFFAPKKNLYETAKVTKADLKITVSASGKIKSDEEATLKFQTSGRLAWVGVKKGDKVTKWQAIASLDKEELKKTLNQELLDYMGKRWDFEQTTQDTYRDLALTETIRRVKDKSQFDLDRSVLDVEIADIAIKYGTIYSPINGIVTEISAPYPGTNIVSATDKFVISNPDKLIFSANVDEADIGKIKSGMSAQIILDAYPDEIITSIIEQIEFTSTLTSGGGTAYAVKFSLPSNQDEKYRLEMNGDAEILISQKNQVLVIPQEAIREENGNQYVWLADNQKPIRKTVQIGETANFMTEIIQGLNEGDQVITSGFKLFEKTDANQ